MKTPQELATLVAARDAAWTAWWETPDRNKESAAFADYLATINAIMAYSRAHGVEVEPRPIPDGFLATADIERASWQMPEPTQLKPDDAQ